MAILTMRSGGILHSATGWKPVERTGKMPVPRLRAKPSAALMAHRAIFNLAQAIGLGERKQPPGGLKGRAKSWLRS